jgi:hypothetical protein
MNFWNRNQSGKSLRAVGELGPQKPIGHQLQRLFPRGLNQPAFPPDEGGPQAVRMRADVIAEKAAGAKIAVIAARPVGRHGFDQLVFHGLQRQMASVSTEAADRIGPLQHPWPIFVQRQPAGDRSDRTDLHAAAAKFAVKRVGGKMFDLRHGSTAGRGERLDIHDLVAIPHATETLHAPVHLRFDQRTEVFLRKDPLDLDKPARRRRVLMREVLKIASAPLIADRTIQRVVGQNEFQHRLVRIVDHRRGRPDHHALGHRRAAGRLKLGNPLDFHQAHAAVGVRLQLGVVAEVRNHDAGLARRLDDERAFRHRHGDAVDRQFHLVGGVDHHGFSD